MTFLPSGMHADSEDQSKRLASSFMTAVPYRRHAAWLRQAISRKRQAHCDAIGRHDVAGTLYQIFVANC